MQKALPHDDVLVEFDETTGRAWRIGDIAFGLEDAEEHAARRTSKGAYRDIEDVLGSLDEGGTGLSGAERIRLVATVTLRATPDSVASLSLRERDRG